jgi:hypothetical protein
VNLFAPHRGEPLPATRELIATVIAELPTAPSGDQFAILGPDDLTYVQTLLTPDGFVLQYQEGSTERHFESTRGDVREAEVVEALGAYLDGNPAWRWPFEWRPVEVRPVSYRLGLGTGRLLGRIFGRSKP